MGISRICKIRIISFIAAGALVAVGFIIMMSYRENQLRATINNGYNESLAELSNYLNKMSETLEYESYTANPQQMRIFANKLSADSACAKSALERLPVSSRYTSGLYRFLSQAGEYSQYLAAVNMRKLNNDEQKALNELHDYAKAMSAAVSDIQAVSAEKTSGWWADEAAYQLKKFNGSTDLSAIEKYADEVSQNTKDYAKINYDGTNSDHLLNATAKLIQNKPTLSENEAAKAAAKILSVNSGKCKLISTDKGSVRLYIFGSGTKQAAITQSGGELYYMTDYREISQQKIDETEARKRSAEYMNKHYGANFRLIECALDNGRYTVNFVYVQDGVLCYPDEIKIDVAADNGDIVGVQAHGYVHNHRERSFDFANSEQSARNALSVKLNVVSAEKCVISVDSDAEYCCYEFVCSEKNGNSEDNKKVHVFVDAKDLFIRKITK